MSGLNCRVKHERENHRMSGYDIQFPTEKQKVDQTFLTRLLGLVFISEKWQTSSVYLHENLLSVLE
jgi:hypothetical protein